MSSVEPPLVTCVWMPRFALRVVTHRRVSLDGPVALVEAGSGAPRVLDRTDAAAADGVEVGMSMARALGCCAALVVVESDVERIAHASEALLARLEGIGAAVQGVEPGLALFELDCLERLYGGPGGVLTAVRGAFRAGAGGDVHVGVGPGPFPAWVAARYAPPGGKLVIGSVRECGAMLAPLPLGLLPAAPATLDLLDALGLVTLGDLAGLARARVSERFGQTGLQLHDLARGIDPRRVAARVPIDPVVERLQFPEPVGSLITLGQAVRMLIERAVAHPRCTLHAPRTVVVAAMLAGGGSFRVERAMRTPTVDPERIALTALHGIEALTAPVDEVSVRFEQFELREVRQPTLLAADAPGGGLGTAQARDRATLAAGVRHVQATVGEDAMLQVLEVEPWSRVPERHAVLVPAQGRSGGSGLDAHGDDVGAGIWSPA